MMGSAGGATRRVAIGRLSVDRAGGQGLHRERDAVATEEPMQIRLLPASERDARRATPVAVTMRTPGNDFELAAGFLFGEGIVRLRDDLVAIRNCTDLDEAERHNIVTAHLRAPAVPMGLHLERHFTMTSACGVCGKAHLAALEVRCPAPLSRGPELPAEVLLGLPASLREAQTVFGRTGGLHAAGLFTADGGLVALREDVGRHNALDKLIGWAFLEGRLPLVDQVVCVSGRASYELLQKAVVAGVPVVAAVSAPSSLAIEVAERFGATLIGFLRDQRFNVYSGAQRLVEYAP